MTEKRNIWEDLEQGNGKQKCEYIIIPQMKQKMGKKIALDDHFN